MTGAAFALDVRYGPAVPDQKKAQFQQALNTASAFLTGPLGLRLEGSTKVFVAKDPTVLAKAFLSHTRLPAARYPEVLDRFSTGEFAAVAVDGAVFMQTGALQFNRRRGGVSIQDGITRTVTHELFHTVQYRLLRRKGRRSRLDTLGPDWLAEGAAVYIARLRERQLGLYDFDGWAKKTLRRRARLKGDLSLLDTRLGLNMTRYSYDISTAAVLLLVQDKGPAPVLQFYRGLGAGKSWKRSFRESFGIDADAFYAAF